MILLETIIIYIMTNINKLFIKYAQKKMKNFNTYNSYGADILR